STPLPSPSVTPRAGCSPPSQRGFSRAGCPTTISPPGDGQAPSHTRRNLISTGPPGKIDSPAVPLNLRLSIFDATEACPLRRVPAAPAPRARLCGSIAVRPLPSPRASAILLAMRGWPVGLLLWLVLLAAAETVGFVQVWRFFVQSEHGQLLDYVAL